MNLVLIGYRGTGKTSVARCVADLLAMPVVSTDERVTARAARSIPEIVSEGGWERFRDLESQAVEEAAGRDGTIIDCGGGAVLRRENARLLARNGVIFLLTAGVDEIVSRIQNSADRPSLTDGQRFLDEVPGVLREREPIYRQSADYVVSTSNRTVGDVASQIARLFRLLSLQIGRAPVDE